ncbi:hypothetical protein [Mesorhizobium sp. B1-1-8]|uniref:hypothetical protein n=1 Tax=Mesorhizobium sp. B1-1-8 TaxID=2589976 RepID=UPI00112ABDB0|nr:hypothetical protein [Mesorhizobium sp. B1-1-8]UCI05308.1 hypothetical protein FJ974_15730 [Mesorhizobium sp. B1-1-8]
MQALLIAAAVLVIGLALAYGIKRFSLGDSVTLIALLIIPLLAYGVVSGQITEFTAPGGWGAKFRAEARKTIEPLPILKADLVPKGGEDELQALLKKLVPGNPIALTLQLGRGGYYQAQIIVEYITALSRIDPEMTVIVVDQDGKYVSSAKGSAVLSLLQDAAQTQPFMSAIGGSSPTEITKIGGFSDKSIFDKASNVEALKKMQSENVSRLVAVTVAGLPEGIVLRDTIVTRLLVELAPDDQ